MPKVDAKICAKCGRYKKASEFPKNKAMRSGLHSYCLECKREYYQQRKQQTGNTQSKVRHLRVIKGVANTALDDSDKDLLIQLVIDSTRGEGQ